MRLIKNLQNQINKRKKALTFNDTIRLPKDNKKFLMVLKAKYFL